MIRHSLQSAIAFLWLASSCCLANPPSIDFARDVFPIFQRSCIECHGESKQEGGFRLDQREDFLDSGMVEVGQPDESELLRRVMLPRGHSEVMPAIGEPLAGRDVAAIRQWILDGANWPADFAVAKHWSYVPPRRPELPAASSKERWPESPIDHFILKQLEREGLEPSPAAPQEKLVRRVFLDLIGLPPTPAEVTAYLANKSERRFEELIDELMQRPEFGERWARPWLDLARYADSHGFQRDDLRDIWAYRDWVIQALNDDMPFDQFTIEQIAGDLLPGGGESQRIATGFHRCTPTNVEAGSLPEETRIEQVLDRVNTTGAVWLGTTLECCQCHDHKYDPFTIKEYYQLLAFYNNTEREADRADEKTPSSIKFNGPSMAIANPERDSRREELSSRLVTAQEQLAHRREHLDSSLDAWLPEFQSELNSAARSHVLSIQDFESLGSTDSHSMLEDGSVLLVGGDPPDRDEYTFRVRTELSDIRAFRLEVLRHQSLPGMGPGRGDPVRRNFVLNDFTVQHTADSSRAESVGQKLEFATAKASFSQKNWDVGGAISDDAKKGWAISPKFDESHWAMFILKEPLAASDGIELRVSLTQNYGSARTIGCFRLLAMTGNIDADSTPAEIISIAELPTEQWTKKQRAKMLDFRVASDAVSKRIAQQLTKLEKQIEELAPDTTLVMVELPERRVCTVFERGDYRTPGEPVEPRTPDVLHAMPEGPPNRLTLARWLVARDNPLVARVTVNRWWAEIFGEGIVATPEDFGIKGEPPSHPDLLDWLAVEFMENDWSTKHILKTILMSSTYQQSSAISAELAERDPRNRLLARGPRFRMSAEAIRDNALAISGLLCLNKMGPSIRPFQPAGIWKKVGGTAYNYEVSPGGEQYRRGIYVVLKRGSPYPSFMNFDASQRLTCTVERSRTNTPLQALTLLNDPVYVSAAEALAERVQRESDDVSLDAKLEYAFRLCTSRRPTDLERDTLRKLFEDARREAGGEEGKAWYSVASVLLNLHETITKD